MQGGIVLGPDYYTAGAAGGRNACRVRRYDLTRVQAFFLLLCGISMVMAAAMQLQQSTPL